MKELEYFFGPELLRQLCERAHTDPYIHNMLRMIEVGTPPVDAVVQVLLAFSAERELLMKELVRAAELRPTQIVIGAPR